VLKRALPVDLEVLEEARREASRAGGRRSSDVGGMLCVDSVEDDMVGADVVESEVFGAGCIPVSSAVAGASCAVSGGCAIG